MIALPFRVSVIIIGLVVFACFHAKPWVVIVSLPCVMIPFRVAVVWVIDVAALV